MQAEQEKREELEFGSRLAALRKAAGLSQQQLADQLYVTRQAVSRWEQNRTQPDIATLQRLAKALGCSLEQLVAGLDEDAGRRRRNAAWAKTTRRAFWVSACLQAGLLVLGILRQDFMTILLPILLFLCGGSLHPMLSVMAASGDYSMLAGYDRDAEYDTDQLETLVRAMDLWVQLTTLGITLLAVPLAFFSGEGFAVVVIIQTVSLLTTLIAVQYRYGRKVTKSYPGLAALSPEGRPPRPEQVEAQTTKPTLWWGALFLVQLFACFFCVIAFHIPNNSPGAMMQMAFSLPGILLGVVFLLWQTSRAKRCAAQGLPWRMGKGGAALLAGAVLCLVFQLLAALAGGGSW